VGSVSGSAVLRWTRGTDNNGYVGSPASRNFHIAATPNVNITVDTNPSGLEIIVDSQSYTAPQVFNWEEGTRHTLSAPLSQDGAPGTRYEFDYWSDSGAATHDIIVPASPATYTAYYVTQHLLTIGIQPAKKGTVTTVPAGDNGWFDENTDVEMTAVPAKKYGFDYWSGDASGSDNPTNILMNAPKSVTAHFVRL